jgi:HNH endonuclease
MEGLMSGRLLDTMGRANRKLQDKSCKACGIAFRPLRSSSAFCSRPCARTINGGHNYKGESWWIDQKGYIAGRVWVDGKPKHVKRHRWEMERHLGRAINAGDDVHHLDGNKQNNAIENLEVVSHSKHSTITNRNRWNRAILAKPESDK